MTKSNLTSTLISLSLILILFACSTAPLKQATMDELKGLKLNRYFTIDNSLEEILEHINRTGEVIIEATSKKKRGVKAKPYYIKIMATSIGLETNLFPREPTD